jgi:hypothetical protein
MTVSSVSTLTAQSPEGFEDADFVVHEQHFGFGLRHFSEAP